jgi:Fe(3+) dicitrate transport protein
MERLRPYTLHDAFDFVPGVRTIDDDALGRRSGIGIRGAPPRRSRKTLLLEDGTPINASTYLDPSAHYTPPVERLERTEVLRGAGQIVHGPLNNYGVINFRNRSATAEPRTRLELAGGSASTFRRHVSHTRTIGVAGIVASYTGMDADGTFDVERHRYDDLFGSVALRLGTATSVQATTTAFRERSRGYDEGNLTPQQFALHPRSKLLLDEGREWNSMAVAYLRGDIGIDAEPVTGVRFSGRAWATDLDRPRFQTRGISPAEGGMMEGRDRHYRTMGAEARAELGGYGTHVLQMGLRVERHRFTDSRPVGRPGEALDHAHRGNAFASEGADGYTANGRVVRYHAPAASGFTQAVLRTGRWTITPGVRVETYAQQREIVFWPGSDDEGAIMRERNTLLLPGVSVLFGASAATQLYAGVHRGYAPATARTEEFPLLPEKGTNFQVGVRSATLPGVAVELAAFHSRISNTLIRQDVDVFGDGLFVNAADARVSGADVSLRARAPTGLLDRAGLFMEGAWNVTRARFATAPLEGLTIPEIPRMAGSLTVGAERTGRWHASATASHLGAFFADVENTRELSEDAGRVPARTLLSARLSRSLTRPGVTLWLHGRNLADRLYISDVQDGLRPGAPRTLTAGATVSF